MLKIYKIKKINIFIVVGYICILHNLFSLTNITLSLNKQSKFIAMQKKSRNFKKQKRSKKDSIEKIKQLLMKILIMLGLINLFILNIFVINKFDLLNFNNINNSKDLNINDKNNDVKNINIDKQINIVKNKISNIENSLGQLKQNQINIENSLGQLKTNQINIENNLGQLKTNQINIENSLGQLKQNQINIDSLNKNSMLYIYELTNYLIQVSCHIQNINNKNTQTQGNVYQCSITNNTPQEHISIETIIEELKIMSNDINSIVIKIQKKIEI